MENGLYIALLNPSISLVLATAFFALWLYQRRHRHVAVLALGYAAAAGGFLLQYFILPPGFNATKVASNVLFFTTTLCIASAIISRCGRRVPILAFGVLTAGGLGAFCWFMFVDPDLPWRIYSINFALGAMCLVAGAELRAIQGRTAIHRVLLGLALAAGLNFFVRPLLCMYVDGPYETYEGFYRSIYWTTVLLTHAILSIAIALTLIASIALDLIAELRSESETDPLSGLLNRRGFMERTSKILADVERRGVPVSLVICDLDHFKQVNDDLGHVAGDLVISGFAGFLREATAAEHAAGRIGGEEFAIILPGADLTAARLFAEGTRAAFAMLAVEGLPESRRFSASFGVAELIQGEGVAELLARADAALYLAKREGRNCVRVARPSYTRPSAFPRDKAARSTLYGVGGLGNPG
ncbi:GGDEF domain-containing protein [Mesorhizobium sp. BAC0120]|uniref:GGDEF domain-containing protein n=1 Tax=Mesorhizobium sp. BAC0120 TaxID=3090670 RepID=UPI00298C7C53|nr:GGDEF domain-containing protein [Mesorhizobium sp. BAC0120]MDW6021681.1 GGDEF domain-containing protein [Mesorhizobium sp. BAC0120]